MVNRGPGVFCYPIPKVGWFMMILYAEDDVDDFFLVAEVLGKIDSSIECINAINGRDLLDMLDGMYTQPDLILLDVNMPTMDGISCLKELRSNPRFTGIPVHVFSTSTDPRQVRQCVELGAVEYKTKPADISDLTSYLANLVVKRQV